MCTAGKCVFTDGTVTLDASVSPAIDRDHDGVPDISDNCPDTANADQTANEDGDKFGDACDLCPHVADTAAVDTDGDRIGDVCDPHPGVRDSLWLFEGFHKGLPAWARTPNWAAVGDKLRVTASGDTNTDGDDLVLPLTSPDGTYNNFSITATVVVETRTGTSGYHSIGIEIYDATAQKGVDCSLDQNPAVPNGILLLMDDFNTGVDKEPPFAWTNNTEYRLTMTRQGSTYTCTVVGVGAAGVTQTATGTSAVVPRNGASVVVDVWAYGVTAQLGSIFVAGAP